MNKREQQKEKTLGDILRISEELFHNTGFEKTTIQKIADSCGLSKGALYHHFKSKEEVLERICRNYYRQARSVFLPIAEKEGPDMYEKIRDIMVIARNSRMNSAAVSFRKNGDKPGIPGSQNALLDTVMGYYGQKLYKEVFSQILEEGRKDGLCSFYGSAGVTAVFIHSLDTGMERQLNDILSAPDYSAAETAVQDVIEGFSHALSRLLTIPYDKVCEITLSGPMLNQHLEVLRERRSTRK